MLAKKENKKVSFKKERSRRGRDRIAVGFTTTYAIIAYHHNNVVSAHGEVYSIQHYDNVIKFVSDLRQVDGFLQVLQFPPPIKLTTTKYC